MDVTSIQQRLRDFARERDWEEYHSPKNLSMALSVEAAELMELFQWVTPEQSRRVGDHENNLRELEEELADVAIYVLRLADVAGIDIEAAINRKIEANAVKYPPGSGKQWGM